jgi:hypothetical protein
MTFGRILLYILLQPNIDKARGNVTLRMDLAYVAMAALALLISDVAATRAATKPCDVMPERCRYNSLGRRIFYAPGYRMPESTVTPPTSARQATDRSAWGCGATDGVATGRSWGFPNKTAASYRALAECTQRSTHERCRVVSCSPFVHTYYDAHVAWFSDAHR